MKKSKTNQPAVRRAACNPLLSADDVRPSHQDLKVDGIFNCGATKYNGEYLLLCRVAESARDVKPGTVAFPTLVRCGGKNGLQIVSLEKAEHPELDFSDSRTISHRESSSRSIAYLTSFSHLRLAHSRDGLHFTLEDHPFLEPDAETESWGMEDPRITRIGGTYYINYTAVSPNGAATTLISTEDFRTVRRHGLIFLPENKDVTIFPERINGKYMAFNRPVPCSIGNPDIWISESDDLIHWGRHRHFQGVSEQGWENGRIGGGAPPFRTEKGWVKIYHAADRNQRYCLGAFLLDGDDPSKVIAKSREPILKPEAPYEKEGFFDNVVFTCGCIFEDGIVKIYYGAADNKICRADISLKDLFIYLGVL
jgi:predicted GH43/DUF377 family glycosyl hydrolase